MKLADYTAGRDNNFNLIRILAALAVLVTHSYALTTGSSRAEPLRAMLGMSLGDIAVYAFFITSGFLVTSSLLNRQRTLDFIRARMLRIYPALWVMLLLTVFPLGLYFTAWTTSEYLSSRQTYSYLATNAFLVTNVDFVLPGVFHDLPYFDTVNGSLWTMPFEVRMYAILAVLWGALKIAPRMRLTALKAGVVAFAAVAGGYLLAGKYAGAAWLYRYVSYDFVMFFFMFFTGASLFVLRRHIVLAHRMFIVLLVALLLSVAYIQLFFAAFLLSFAYLLLYLAYVPAGFVRHYNRLGDYSYGVYIYAWPVQQSIIASMPGITPGQLSIAASLATLVLAVLSWHLLERKALNLKARYNRESVAERRYVPTENAKP